MKLKTLALAIVAVGLMAYADNSNAGGHVNWSVGVGGHNHGTSGAIGVNSHNHYYPYPQWGYVDQYSYPTGRIAYVPHGSVIYAQPYLPPVAVQKQVIYVWYDSDGNRVESLTPPPKHKK